VTAELSKYQELLGRDTGADSARESVHGDDQSSAPPTTNFSGASIASAYSSPTSAMNVLTSGVCFRPDEDYLETAHQDYVLGSFQLDRLAAYGLFSESVVPTKLSSPARGHARRCLTDPRWQVSSSALSALPGS